MVVGAAALVVASAGWAAEVYRWTDAQGVLHIADVPPPKGHSVQTQTLPDPAPRVDAPAPAVAPDAPAAAADKGPAQVVITEKNEEPLGGSRHGVSGTVENKGGATARDVAIAVRVISPAQGDECLNEEIAVSPSMLKPGEKAEFTADFDNPCFRGPTQVDLRAQWE